MKKTYPSCCSFWRAFCVITNVRPKDPFEAMLHRHRGLLFSLCRHYSRRGLEVDDLLQELTVAQVSGFKLNESQRVDVVIVVADDDSGWQKLTKELNIKGENGVVSWLGDIRKPAQRVKWTGAPVLRVVASHARRTLAFYRVNTEAQYDALLDYQLNNMKQSK